MARSGRLDLGNVLQAVDAASPAEAIETLARELGVAFDAVAVSFLITDLTGRAVVRLGQAPVWRSDGESATVLPLEGGPREQALRTQTVQVSHPGAAPEGRSTGLWQVLAPVTERGESIGLLELYLPDEPDHEVVTDIHQVAHLLAFVIIANRRHTDLFERAQRSTEFNLSAEIQQRLLPEARSCEASAFTLAGWLEPAASIGGDTFDYSLARDVLHLSITDAMGHGIDAALTASLCLAGLRGGRRRGMSLLEQATSANATLFDYTMNGATDDFVTGLIGRVDLRHGVLDMVNAGHVAPYLLRDDEVTMIFEQPAMPLGIFADTVYDSHQLQLIRGDRVVFVTDGMLERRVSTVDLPTAIRDTRDLHPREVVRALADSALEAAGHALQDDATLLCLDWHGMHSEDRDTSSGADPQRASARLDVRPATRRPDEARRHRGS